ncbi:MAG: acyl-CoA dehydrogenase family protein [Actinomycetota bacterium]|nr:acyl-CoA dehydrogenase family protein [Actinomycetota bacterium]
MDFSLSEEEKGARRMLRGFAMRAIGPRAAVVDADPEHRFDWELVGKADGLHIMGMPIPEEYDGAGLSLFSLFIAAEELAYGDAGFSSCIGISWLNEVMILMEGRPENYRRFLPMLSSEEGVMSANAVTEAMGVSDSWTYNRYIPGTLRTMSRRDGNDYVTNGGLAGLYLVLASLDPGGGRDRSAYFYVTGDAPWVSVGRVEDKMGQRALQNAEVVFADVRVPAGTSKARREKACGTWRTCIIPWLAGRRARAP